VVWYGSRTWTEEIKAEIQPFLARELNPMLSEEKTHITHIVRGSTSWDSLQGDKRWADGQWCLFSQVPPRAIKRLREAVKSITQNTFTDEVAAFTALAGLIRGWGHYYARAADSRLRDSLDAFIYQEEWKYCLQKREGRAKRAYHQYALPRPVRQAGTFTGRSIGMGTWWISCSVRRGTRRRRKPSSAPHALSPVVSRSGSLAMGTTPILVPSKLS
jgi:hypothetical protein